MLTFAFDFVSFTVYAPLGTPIPLLSMTRCTWRHVATTSAINASCMYNRIDTAIEKADPDCFNTCPPNNKTTDCYNKCYFDATMAMTREELVAPWTLAMSRTPEGCPQVDLSSVKAPAHHKPQPDSQRNGGFVGGVW